MRLGNEAAQMNLLERGLLSKPGSCDEDSGSEDETILYTASFQEMEDNFVKYQTAQWVLYSLLLICLGDLDCSCCFIYQYVDIYFGRIFSRGSYMSHLMP